MQHTCIALPSGNISPSADIILLLHRVQLPHTEKGFVDVEDDGFHWIQDSNLHSGQRLLQHMLRADHCGVETCEPWIVSPACGHADLKCNPVVDGSITLT